MNCYLLRQSRTKMKKCCWKDSFLNYDFPPLKLFFSFKKESKREEEVFSYVRVERKAFVVFTIFIGSGAE